MITTTEMEKRKKLIETSSINFDVSSFLSSDFPTYESYNHFMNMYEEKRKEKGSVTSIECYKLMRKSLVLPGSNKEVAIRLANSSHPTLELVLRAYTPLFYSLFSDENYSLDSKGTDFVDLILKNMRKLPCIGSQYNSRQLRQAINYTVYPDLMQAPKGEGDMKWEAGFRQFLLTKSADELKIMFNNDFTSPDYFLYHSAQVDEFKSVLYSIPKGAEGEWAGSQIKYALENALKVGFETETKAITDLYTRSKEEKYFLVKHATDSVRHSYLPANHWYNLNQFFIEEWHDNTHDELKAVELAFHRLFTKLRVPVIGVVRKVLTTHKTKETTTVTTIDLSCKTQQGYPGHYPLSDQVTLRNFLILSDRRLMSIVKEGKFLSWSRDRDTLNTEFQKAIKDKSKTARQVREAIEKHFSQFGWKDFPTFAELVEAGRQRAMIH